MKTPIYNVKDLKVGVWGQPNFQYRNDADALRGFDMASNKQGTQFYEFPQDYAFYKLGTWDDETGEFEMLPQPVSLGLASDFKKSLAPTLSPVQN